MPTFSARSKQILATCDRRLQLVLQLAIRDIDFSVREGHRGRAAQEAAVAAGTSKLHYPRSKHNRYPALAVDIYPYPFRDEYWRQFEPWRAQAVVVLACGARLGVPLRWGGDWDRDGDSADEPNFDGPHFEIDA